MAAFTSAQNGFWRDGGTWGNTSPGVEGVDYPGAGDTATIAHSVSWSYDDGATAYGAIAINSGGLLHMPDGVDRTLRVAGNIAINSGGALRMNPSGAAAADGQTNTLIIDCATAGGYAITVANGGLLEAVGASKTTLYAIPTAGGAAVGNGTGANPLVLQGDLTGDWAVGDDVLLLPNPDSSKKGPTNSEHETFTIGAISVNGGNTEIELDQYRNPGTGDTLAYDHDNYQSVANGEFGRCYDLRRNVVIKSQSATYPANIRFSGCDSAQGLKLQWVSIEDMGDAACTGEAAVYISASDHAANAVESCVFLGGNDEHLRISGSTGVTVADCVMVAPADHGIQVINTPASDLIVSGCVVVAAVDWGIYINTAEFYSSSVSGCVVSNCHGSTYNSHNISLNAVSGGVVEDCVAYNAANGLYAYAYASGAIAKLRTSRFVACTYGIVLASTDLFMANNLLGSPVANTTADITVTNLSKVRSFNDLYGSTVDVVIDEREDTLTADQYDQSSGAWREVQKYGIVRKNGPEARGGSGFCLEFSPSNATHDLAFEFAFNVSSADTAVALDLHAKTNAAFNGAATIEVLNVGDADGDYRMRGVEMQPFRLDNHANCNNDGTWSGSAISPTLQAANPNADGQVICLIRVTGTAGSFFIDDIAVSGV